MAVKRLLYVRCPVCGSLRRWDKGGFCREVKPFEFVMDELEIRGGAKGWVTRHNWKRLSVTENPAYIIMLENLLTRLQKAERLVQEEIHRVKLALIGRNDEVKKELVQEIDDRIQPDTESVLVNRIWLATLNWRMNSWLVERSRSLQTTQPCSIGLTMTVTRASATSVLGSNSTARPDGLSSGLSVVEHAPKKLTLQSKHSLRLCQKGDGLNT